MPDIKSPGVYVEEVDAGVTPIAGVIATISESITERFCVIGQIALSLSGGGYRADAFHLGTLSYLSRLDLLKDVTILSTVAGGALVGMKYALSLKQGASFFELL